MKKLFLSELRVLVGKDLDVKNTIVNPNYEKAFVDVENLMALGYFLKDEGVTKLAYEYALDETMEPLYKQVMSFIPEIKASPMYPNFPIQVLEMDINEYLANKYLHYATTYGLESAFNMEVQKGWLPKTDEIMTRKDDVQVRKLILLDYISPEELNDLVINKIIGKRERLLPNELLIAKYVIAQYGRNAVLDIPFKENIGAIYGDFLLNGDLEQRYSVLHELENIMKHPGDVLDLTEELVVKNKYKQLKTSLKRGLVNLIENFPLAAIEENFASNRWSNKFLGKKGKARAINRNIALIDYLSYSKFSKKPGAMNIVNQLKDGELQSWSQKLEKAYKDNNINEALRLLNQRPGIYFRQINRLYKNGAPLNVLSEDVKKFAEELKTQSIVSALNNYEGELEVTKVFYDALISNLQSKNVDSVKGKKVFFDEGQISSKNSKLIITDKFEEGGYIQNGMAIKIPEEAKYIRFFTYWNDKRRIDIDLHSAFTNTKNDRVRHVGYWSSPSYSGIVFSGDITHSDAAEYIDIDIETALANNVNKVQFNINSYTQVKFKDIETVFTGIMLLSEMGQEVELYDDKNTVFRHDLNGNHMSVDYGFIDLRKGIIQILGTPSSRHNDKNFSDGHDIQLSIKDYVNILLASQECELVKSREDAEVIIGFEKSNEENYVSLIDENFFMDE